VAVADGVCAHPKVRELQHGVGLIEDREDQDILRVSGRGISVTTPLWGRRQGHHHGPYLWFDIPVDDWRLPCVDIFQACRTHRQSGVSSWSSRVLGCVPRKIFRRYCTAVGTSMNFFSGGSTSHLFVLR
jgi:hypothetical protein